MEYPGKIYYYSTYQHETTKRLKSKAKHLQPPHFSGKLLGTNEISQVYFCLYNTLCYTTPIVRFFCGGRGAANQGAIAQSGNVRVDGWWGEPETWRTHSKKTWHSCIIEDLKS